MSVVRSTHLTYCTNVHPGQTLDELSNSLLRHTAKVSEQLDWENQFSVGLRLSNQCATQLGSQAAFEEFSQLLRTHSFYVVTLNGFPYGPFHGESVKDKVYLPDWSSEERLNYTKRLIQLLSGLLPDGCSGSISTVPGAYKSACRATKDRNAIAQNLIRACADLVELERRSGQLVRLALEPEPCCLLETTDETIDFFQNHLLDEAALDYLGLLTGAHKSDAERLLRRHLGVCLDACHAAVEFESPLDTLTRLEAAGLTVAKVQISAALKLDPRDAARRRALRQFDETVYLHQVVERNDGKLTRFVDLPQAFATAEPQLWTDDAEWRVHFHVPVFTTDCGHFTSTQDTLPPLLATLGARAEPPHVEVETYTWGVLPAQLQPASLDEAIAAELRWTQRHLSSPDTQ